MNSSYSIFSISKKPQPAFFISLITHTDVENSITGNKYLLYPLASDNISFQIMMNKEAAKHVQIVYQNNGVHSNAHFLFVCDDLTNIKILALDTKIFIKNIYLQIQQ